MNTPATTIGLKESSFYDTIKDCLKSNAIFITIAVYLLIVLFFFTNDPDKLFEQQYLYSAVIVVPLIAVTVYYIKLNVPQVSAFSITDFMKYGTGLLAIIGVVYLVNYISLHDNVVKLFTGSFTIITVLIIIVALAIVYKVLFNYFYKIDGMNGFIINMIFYIPCMVLNGLEYLSNDFKQTPFTVYVLLMIEILLLLAYFYLPKITQLITNSVNIKDGKPIITEPMLIKRRENISSYIAMTDHDPKMGNIVNNKFAISMWVYVVPVPPTVYPYNGDATIFEFGNYHPRLIYNGSTNMFKSFMNQSDSTEFTMPLQAWNHVVYNYTKSSVDLFVNGKLVATKPARSMVNEGLRMDDILSIGQDNGLSGGICNVVYFKTPLFKYEIENIYNLNKMKDPPI
jgi:hypothetical protein